MVKIPTREAINHNQGIIPPVNRSTSPYLNSGGLTRPVTTIYNIDTSQPPRQGFAHAADGDLIQIFIFDFCNRTRQGTFLLGSISNHYQLLAGNSLWLECYI